jgi:septal ring factor EnvC (AmiA/AmiB activator)
MQHPAEIFMLMRRLATGVLAAVVLLLAATDLSAEDPAARRKELQRIKREMQQKKQALKQADRKERSILTELDRIDREVQSGKTELSQQQKLLGDAETSLRDVEKNHARISRDLTGLKQAYARRIRALYKMSRNGTAAAVLTDAEGDAGKHIKYLALIAQRDREVMLNYRTSLDRLAMQETEISEKKAALQRRQQAIETKKADLQDRKRRKAMLLASVREEKELSEQTLHELEEASTSLWSMVRKDEQERKTRKAVKVFPPVRQADVGTGRLPWPLEGAVLTRFGMQNHPQFKTKVFRRGIEIAAREGDPVHAVNDGQVAFADWYKGYGKLMIVDHGAGFYTLYGNLSRLDLNRGDQVRRGQVVGLAGDTGSLKGSKLYFEIRRNGEAQDPLQWLAKR